MSGPASTPDAPRFTPESVRRRARVIGVLLLVLAVVCAVLAAVGYSWAATAPGTLASPLTLSVLTVLAALLAVLAFQAGRHYPDTLKLSGPLRLFGFVAVAVGAAGALVVVIVCIATATALGLFLAVPVFAIGLLQLFISALLYRLVVPVPPAPGGRTAAG
ncbi:hypothetical protein [Microbacterium luticocti]|uniref:hypothetical protein n=1 Tax=Microbacterium luticocti TaxID=451764 RepID=UPI000408037C|nr:hypothetical protein [Microbacterium luticocti]